MTHHHIIVAATVILYGLTVLSVLTALATLPRPRLRRKRGA